jgi:hypothetical protein
LPYGPRPREREDVSILLAIPLAQGEREEAEREKIPKLREEAKEARGWSKASVICFLHSQCHQFIHSRQGEKLCTVQEKTPGREKRLKRTMVGGRPRSSAFPTTGVIIISSHWEKRPQKQWVNTGDYYYLQPCNIESTPQLPRK